MNTICTVEHWFDLTHDRTRFLNALEGHFPSYEVEMVVPKREDERLGFILFYLHVPEHMVDEVQKFLGDYTAERESRRGRFMSLQFTEPA